MLNFLEFVELNETRKIQQTGTTAIVGPHGASIDDRNANYERERQQNVRSSKIKSVNEPDDVHGQKEGSEERVKSMANVLSRGGKLPPLHVQNTGNGYKVLDGHHRWKAHRKVGSKQVPVIVIDRKNITHEQ